MKRSVPLLAAAVFAVSGLVVLQVNEPNRLTCEGYDETRVFLENQSWVEPQPGPPGHPGTGQQGHIHISTCFPLHQAVTSPVLSLDIRVQLHNVPGVVQHLNVGTYAPGTGGTLLLTFPQDDCPTVDCDRWVHVDFPLSQVPKSGWVEFNIYPIVFLTDANGVKTGQKWYNVPRWFLDVQNGAPAQSPPLPANQIRIGGDTWLTAEGTGTKYSEARIMNWSFPWDLSTGEPVPVSGVWSPEVWFNGDEGLVLIDPALHAVPPDMGIQVWEGVPVATGQNPKRMTITIDTTTLTDGAHRMLLISCDDRPSGARNCGVLVVPFIVDNS